MSEIREVDSNVLLALVAQRKLDLNDLRVMEAVLLGQVTTVKGMAHRVRTSPGSVRRSLKRLKLYAVELFAGRTP